MLADLQRIGVGEVCGGVVVEADEPDDDGNSAVVRGSGGHGGLDGTTHSAKNIQGEQIRCVGVWGSTGCSTMLFNFHASAPHIDHGR
jgi:hypothetical protein